MLRLITLHHIKPLSFTGEGRNFTKLYMVLSKVMRSVRYKRTYNPQPPRILPNPLLINYNTNKHCDYQQTLGHDTDHCLALRHAVEDLIKKKLLIPLKTRQNTTLNPLSAHNVTLIPNTNTIALKNFSFKVLIIPSPQNQPIFF